MTWKVKRWRCPECFLYFDLSSLNLSWGDKHLVMKDKRGKGDHPEQRTKPGSTPHIRLCPGTWILTGKGKGGQHQGSQCDWLRAPGNSPGHCFRQQACPRTRSGKINRYGLAHSQMLYLPRTGQLLTFNINVHPSLFPIAHPVGAPRDKLLPSWAVAVVERESEKQALDLRFLQNSGAVPKQNQFGIQVSKTTFVSSNF